MAGLTYQSGFVLTDGDGNEVAHVLPCKLKFRTGGYGGEETTYRTVSLDQQTINVHTFSGGAEQFEAMIRFNGDPNGLRALLREGARGRTLNYLPDLAFPSWSYPLVLMSYAQVVRVGMDPQRFGFGEWAARVVMRRVDGGEVASLVNGLLFMHMGGGSMDGYTLTRTTAGTRISREEVVESILAGDRRVDWAPDSVGVRYPHTLIEDVRVQVLINPDTPASWVDIASPVITTGQVDPWGGSVAILVDDDNGAAQEGKRGAVSFTGNAEKVAMVVMRPGTLASVTARIRDVTAGATRHSVVVTWAGQGEPTVVTGTGSGTIYPTIGIRDASNNRWWIIRFSGTSVVAANTNEVQVFGETGDTGTFYLAGGNASDDTFPTSWQGGSLGTREDDLLVAPFEAPPMAMAGYFAFEERGQPNWVASNGSPLIFNLGAPQNPRLYIFKVVGADTYTAFYALSSGTQRNSTVDLGTPTLGDQIELWFTLLDTGVIQLRGSLNGGAEVVGNASAALALPVAWSDQLITLGGHSTVGNGNIALRAVILAPDPASWSLARFRGRVQ